MSPFLLKKRILALFGSTFATVRHRKPTGWIRRNPGLKFFIPACSRKDTPKFTTRPSNRKGPVPSKLSRRGIEEAPVNAPATSSIPIAIRLNLAHDSAIATSSPTFASSHSFFSNVPQRRLQRLQNGCGNGTISPAARSGGASFSGTPPSICKLSQGKTERDSAEQYVFL